MEHEAKRAAGKLEAKKEFGEGMIKLEMVNGRIKPTKLKDVRGSIKISD